MRSSIGLCLLVGFAFASQHPGWKDNTEYVYHVRGRTLASLHEVEKQYSGILLKSQLVIQPKPNGMLNAIISDAQYVQLQSQLPYGWNTHIPDSELGYQPLGLSNKPFQVEMKEGVISDLIVNKEVSNWEANIIKSIMSQFQLNTNGIQGGDRQVNDEIHDDNFAAFNTIEETVTGNTETWYDIHPLPEYNLEDRPWMVRNLQLKGDGEVIEVVKHKNYSNNMELPSYHYGFAGMGNSRPGTNQMGSFFIRDSISRAILTGKLSRYIIQNTYTVNEIIMSPTLNDKQKGSVVSMLNVTLKEVKSQDTQIDEVSNPVRLGGLVYTYDNPFSNSNEARVRQPSQRKVSHNHDLESEEYNRGQRSTMMKKLRDPSKFKDDNKRRDFDDSRRTNILRRSLEHENTDSSSETQWENYQQDRPQLNGVPESPLLPYTTGYKGMSIKQNKNINVQQSVKKIAKEIADDLQDPETAVTLDTLNKFTIMTSLIRIMKAEELQQVAKDLYTQSSEGPESEAWFAYRDAVAEAGTGPALLIIQEWIQSQKIKGYEASKIVATMSNAVRVPTTEYMQSYFDFIKKPEVGSEEYLNETALLSYTNLVRRVYVDWSESDNQYPVHSFGYFSTREGRKFVKESVIPYLTEKLNKAISEADTQKIHSYIRALGNVGHPMILDAFKPYLEGKKQASQFQRLMMVVAMDKLAELYPSEARLVLFNIYQNVGETEEVRVAAVYQLMRTSPPADMLQRMASYTHMDTHKHVNAAVKSSIENAANLQGNEDSYLRSSAEAAQPLLPRKQYGMQYGFNYIRSYVFDELNYYYKQKTQTYGSNDEFYPKGMKYEMRANLAGFKRRLASVEAMVSSLQELVRVGKLQTYAYKQQKDQQEKHADEQKRQPFSSQNIASLLNLKNDELEQLEGYLHMDFDDLQRIMSFDNHTVEQLPEVIRKFEEELKNEKRYHYTKLTNSREMAMSFPTEMGFPFLFTYDTPLSVKVEGKIKAVASPQISSGGKLHKPDTVEVKSNIEVTVNGKVQSRLSFLTPFDHQQYISGFDKHIQVHMPLHGKVQVDVKNGQVKAEIECEEKHKQSRHFHYSTWPYTSKVDIQNFQPISLQKDTQYIRQKNLHTFDQTFGKKETGMAWQLQINHERQSISLSEMGSLLQHHGVMGSLLSLWNDASIQYSEINAWYLPEKSSVRKLIFQWGYQQKYKPQFESDSNANPAYWTRLSQISDPSARHEDLMKKVGAGIKSAEVAVGEFSVEFQGDKNIKHAIIGGYGKSNVDSKSRVLMYYKKSSDDKDVKPYEMSMQAKSIIPNTNGLDLTYSRKTEPTVDTQVQIMFGTTQKTSSQIKAQIEFRRSEERKQYLAEQLLYAECQREMRQGNYQLPACANMTMSFNLLDRVNVMIQSENLNPDVAETVKTIYNALQINYYPTLQVNRNKGTGKQNQFNLKARFDPDLRFVNFSVKSKDEESIFDNIEVGDWGKTLFVIHPVFHARSRIMSHIFGLHTYRPICVMDQTLASTFNNRTYPLSLGQDWTVALQYVPKQASRENQETSVEEQLRSQIDNYVVLVRQSSESNEGKDVKIAFSSPETNYKLVNIRMYPAQQGQSTGKPKVTVNSQEIKYNDKESHDIGDGYAQIYELPNEEVKVEIRNAFYVIYDGQRMKLTVVNGNFRNSIRGLCGTFNDDKSNDFLTPENCITRDAEQFVRSYELESKKGKEERQKLANSKECVRKEVPLYVNVIPQSASADSRPSESCTKFQTRYVEQNGEICFTIRAMPTCSSHCRQTGHIKKNVSVHCVQKSNAAELWKKQIDQGHSPNFEHKRETKTLEMELPQSCSV